MKPILILLAILLFSACSNKVNPTRVTVSGVIEYYQNDTLKQLQPFQFDIPIKTK